MADQVSSSSFCYYLIRGLKSWEIIVSRFLRSAVLVLLGFKEDGLSEGGPVP